MKVMASRFHGRIISRGQLRYLEMLLRELNSGDVANNLVGRQKEMLIVRVWHGLTRESLADEYLEHIELVGIAACRSTPGNRGAFVCRRISNGVAEFLVVSIWESYEAVVRFTGSEDINAAMYYGEDYRYLMFPEPKVVHYELLIGEQQLRVPIWEKNPFEGTS
jgi:heme-degrading monooxygenase HmoA